MPNEPDTDASPFPTPWAAEGRWPTARELDDWLFGQPSDIRETLLASYITMAVDGAACVDHDHRGQMNGLLNRVIEAGTREALLRHRLDSLPAHLCSQVDGS